MKVIELKDDLKEIKITSDNVDPTKEISHSLVITKVDQENAKGLIIGVYKNGSLCSDYFFPDGDSSMPKKSTDVKDTLRELAKCFDINWKMPIPGIIMMINYRWRRFLKTVKHNYKSFKQDEQVYDDLTELLEKPMIKLFQSIPLEGVQECKCNCNGDGHGGEGDD